MSQKHNKRSSHDSFSYFVEQFADLRILRYRVPGFENLTRNQKILVYYLAEAALCGRDIIYDQNFKYNLIIRKLLESIFIHYKGNKDRKEWQEFVIYLKRVWFSNGIHHHYSTDKFNPGFTKEFFGDLLHKIPEDEWPVSLSKDEVIREIIPIIFDKQKYPKRVCQDQSKDMVTHSGNNFYEKVTQSEAETFYQQMMDPGEDEPVSYGLNSKLIKDHGRIKEKIWKSGGMYGEAIDRIIYWLGKAAEVAETEVQKEGLQKLIEYYRSGDLKKYDEYSILWLKDTQSLIDTVNGFIEMYGDPLGRKATWEAMVNFKDTEATRRTEILSRHAQWFEDHSPIDENYKKKEVRGISAKVIHAAMLGGECYPATPIGINLPNAEWIRKKHGSKSVTIENITHAYHMASLKSGMVEEFSFSVHEIELHQKYGFQANNLHTDLHECLGHGSGQMLAGISADLLKNYYSPIEETRADLFALWFMMDPKLVELGIMSSMDVAVAQYNSYIKNGLLTQLTRIEPGKNIEQAHMRNRQLIAKWCLENGLEEKVIEQRKKDGKTYFVINSYDKLRLLFGKLLAEVQRIKSEGDYESAKMLVEKYGVKVDPQLHQEVLKRFEQLKLAPYSGFVNPKYIPVYEKGDLVDVSIDYNQDYTGQMLEYAEKYSLLPDLN
ncbi:MAG: dihydrofolate reductase [Bacteroidales bacterium]|jgi:dipeptidyl-peptidase-3|nr:dihydrofolate reductase [Bacteroidales bacterium]